MYMAISWHPSRRCDEFNEVNGVAIRQKPFLQLLKGSSNLYKRGSSPAVGCISGHESPYYMCDLI